MSEAALAPAPTEDQVILALGRRFYLNYCDRKGWDPHPFPYCDAASLRYAQIAVGMLGYDDDVDVTVR